MNELPGKASAQLFAGSIRRAFLGSRADSRMLIPTVGQSELYVGGVRTLLEKGKSSLRLRAMVGSLHVRNGRADGVLLKDGTLVRGKSVVSAVPYHALGAILPSDLRHDPEFVRLDSIKSSPIVSVNLWFSMNFMEQDLVGVIGRSTQWLFNRRGIFGERGGRTGYVSAVISAARSVVGLPAETLTAMVAEDVRAVFPRARTAEVIHSVVIKEKRATFSPTPETERIRPGTVTPIRNFFLAGDWTDTGLPATIEGAVQSGFAAAGEILR